MNFDEVYSGKELYYGGHSDGLENFIKKYNIPTGLAVDIGAGEGRNSIFLASLGFKVIAVEPSIEGCKKIELRAKQFDYDIQVINKEFLDCIDDIHNAQLVVLLTSLEHMDPKQYSETFDQVERLMSKGGYIYIVVFTEDDPGAKGDLSHASECAKYIRHYFEHNELLRYLKNIDILEYSEYRKIDTTHGPIHFHNKAKLIGVKHE